MTGGPSLGILRYGVSPTFPVPPRPRDPSARGRVVVGGPYGFVGSCSACPQRALYRSRVATFNAIDTHLRKAHL